MDNKFNPTTIHTALGDLPLGGFRFYETVGSTNDVAIDWAGKNALDMSLVISNEQTSGRGRNGRKWYTPADSSLAFSLILRPGLVESRSVSLFSALGALAVVQAIYKLDIGLQPQIKWPNDVLVKNQKVCGILAELFWSGEQVESLVIGIGVNVSPGSVPPIDSLNFPATSLENVSCRNIDRLDLLYKILKGISDLRKTMGELSFIDAFREHLAFQGEMVSIWSDNTQPRAGIITGIDPDGGLCLQDLNGKNFCAHFGEVHLKPISL